MKFSFLGIIWNLYVPLGFCWCIIGGCIILSPFLYDMMPWWGMVLAFLFALVFLATADSVSTFLERGDS